MELNSAKQQKNSSTMVITKQKNQSPFSFIYKLSPQRMFLMDAIGALLTSSILGLVLAQVNEYFLLSKSTFYILAAYVIVLFLYSTSVYLIKPSNWVPLLRIIAIANAAYCLFTFAIVFFVSQTVSTLAIVYFIGEAGLILTISFIEWTYANKNNGKNFY